MRINRKAIEIEMAERMMTIGETAELCNISNATLHRILSGADVSPRTVGRVARGLSVSVRELVGGDECT